MKLEKSPGYDWNIVYQFEDDSTEVMTVFGQLTIEDALKEARHSLNGVSDMNIGTYVILSAARR